MHVYQFRTLSCNFAGTLALRVRKRRLWREAELQVTNQHAQIFWIRSVKVANARMRRSDPAHVCKDVCKRSARPGTIPLVTLSKRPKPTGIHRRLCSHGIVPISGCRTHEANMQLNERSVAADTGANRDRLLAAISPLQPRAESKRS